MLGTVFRIEEVKENDDGIWHIKLSLCDNETEREIEPVLNYFKNEYNNSTEDYTTGIITLCSFLLDMGKLDTAEMFLKRTLEQLSSNDILNKARCYYQLGNIALHHNKYDIGLKLLNKILKLSPTDHIVIANTYSSIGNIYRYQKHFSKAMESYNTALTICKENNKEDQLTIATCYANIGSFYRLKGSFEEALKYYQKALVIREEYIPVPHPTIGNLHIKLARIYVDRSQEKLAIPHCYKALKIYSKCLPRDHPILSKAYYIAALARQKFDTGRKTIELFDRACVTNLRHSSLPHRWEPLGIKLYQCPRCYKIVYIYNVFGVFNGWSCFTCMKKLVTWRPVISKVNRDLVKLPESDSQQRILQKSYAFHVVPNEPLESLFDLDDERDEHKDE
jgi:predicted negative regulator of RcsB-dependent stress response